HEPTYAERLRATESLRTQLMQMERDGYLRAPTYSGTLLPFSRDEFGNVSFDLSAGIPGMIGRVVTLPMDAMRGSVDPLSDEGVARAAEAALSMTGGSVLAPLERGALGIGGRFRAKPGLPMDHAW